LGNVSVFLLLLYLASLGSWFFGLLWVFDIFYLKNRFLKSKEIKPLFLYWVFCALSFFLLWSLNGVAAFIVGALIAVLLFAFLGSQIFYFSNPREVLLLFSYLVIFASASVFSSYFASSFWFGSLVALTLVLFGIMLDFFKMETGRLDIRKKTYSLVFAFIASQCAWAAFLLPIGFLNVGTLIMAFSIIFGEIATSHFKGRLNKKKAIKHSLAFLGFGALIFLLSVI
jgi:hypothetical protein